MIVLMWNIEKLHTKNLGKEKIEMHSYLVGLELLYFCLSLGLPHFFVCVHESEIWSTYASNLQIRTDNCNFVILVKTTSLDVDLKLRRMRNT